MRYYTRTSEHSKVEGPYTSDALVTLFQSGQISSETLTSTDLGEGFQALDKFRKCDWFPAVKVPEIAILISEEDALSAKRFEQKVSIWNVILNFLIALSFCSTAYANPKSYWTFLSLLMVYSAVGMLIQYLKQDLSKQSSDNS